MRISEIVFLLLAMSWEVVTWGRASDYLQSQKSPISLEALGGAQLPRLLNIDGSYSTFSGPLMGGQATINLLGSATHKISPFGRYLFGTAKDSADGSELAKTSVEAGVEIGLGSDFFVGISYGWESFKHVESGGPETHLSSRTIGVGTGVQFFSVSDSLGLGLQAWYRIGALPKRENRDLVSNSSFDSFDFLLGIRWSPSFSWGATY